jgi:hypothetical protein
VKKKFTMALSNDYMIGKANFYLVLFMLTLLYLQINPLHGAVERMENASKRLSEIDMNLISTVVNMSLTQINDLLDSETVDPTLNLGIAKNSIRDLMFGLYNKSDHITVPVDNAVLCSDHPIDCVIGRLQFTLESLDRKDFAVAKDTLNSIVGSIE